MTFEIPYPPTKKGKSAWNRRFSLNAYYAGKPWPVRKRDAEELHTLTRACLRKARGKAPDGPVEVIFRWNDGLDIDNHAVIGKAVVDALKGAVIQDDNRHYFHRVVHEFWDGGCIQVEVRGVESRGEKSESGSD